MAAGVPWTIIVGKVSCVYKEHWMDCRIPLVELGKQRSADYIVFFSYVRVRVCNT